MDDVQKSGVKKTETKTDIYDIKDNTIQNTPPPTKNPYDNSYQPEEK